jgi:hypothetical protein
VIAFAPIPHILQGRICRGSGDSRATPKDPDTVFAPQRRCRTGRPKRQAVAFGLQPKLVARIQMKFVA